MYLLKQIKRIGVVLTTPFLCDPLSLETDPESDRIIDKRANKISQALWTRVLMFSKIKNKK